MLRTTVHHAASPLRKATVGSLGALLVGVLAAGGSAHATPHHAVAKAKVPPGAAADFRAVAAVPHSSDVWAFATTGTVANLHYFVGHRHHGRWSRVKLPKLGGRYAQINAIAAGSGASVWLAGGRQSAGIQNLPSIWRWSGKKFVAMKLPRMQACACDISSVSASSATNAWAVGSIDTITGTFSTNVALHWNGKKWSAVSNIYGVDFTEVSTSGPDNAFATDGANLYHWNGKAWTQYATPPAGVSVFDIATSSPKLAYAVGEHVNLPSGNTPPAVLRYNAKTWSMVRLPKHIGELPLLSVSMHGKSVWAAGYHVALHSTGGAWQKQVLGRNYSLGAVSAVSPTHAYAVGAWTNQVVLKSYFEVFNGHSWKAAPSKF